MVVYLAGQTAVRPGVGTLTINADGSYEFVPSPNYHGSVPAAIYAITDGAGGVASANLFLTITSVNETPNLVPDIGSTPENTTLIGNVLANDTDPDGDVLTVTQFVVNSVTYAAGAVATVPGVGTLTIQANGAYTFVPFPYYEGPVPVATYTATDGNGGTGSTTLTITVTHINHAPQDGDESYIVDQDTTRTVAAPGLLANATDLDNDTLMVSSYIVLGQDGPFVIGTPYVITGIGTITINANGSFTFAPASGYTGVIPQINYVVSDGQGGTDASLLTLSIAGIPEDAQPVTPDVPPPVDAPTDFPHAILFPHTDGISILDLDTVAWTETDPTKRWFKIHCWGAAGGSRTALSPNGKGGAGGYTVAYVNNPRVTVGQKYWRSMVGTGGISDQGGAGAIITNPPTGFGWGGAGTGAGDVDSLPTPCSGGGGTTLFIGAGSPTGPNTYPPILVSAGGGGGAGGDFNSDSVIAGAGNGGGSKTANIGGFTYNSHPENVLNGRSYGGGGGGYRGGDAGFRTSANGGKSGAGGSGYGHPTYCQSVAVFAAAAGAPLSPGPDLDNKGNAGNTTNGTGHHGVIIIEHN